jgi:hypothetical protein
LAIHTPELGTRGGIPITISSGPVRRLIIEGEDSAGWTSAYGETQAYLYPPPIHEAKFHLRDDPVRLTLTALNEFGRSAPIEITIDPVLPAPFGSPKLIFPAKVNAVFGAAVKIPIKAENDQYWSSLRAYGLPEGLSYDPEEQAITGHALVPGVYKIHLLPIRWERPSGSYYYTVVPSLSAPITLTIGAPKFAPVDAGNFAGLLAGSENLTGLWTLAIRPDRRFTGTINLPSGTHSLRGTLSAEAGLSGTYSASLEIPRKKLPKLELTIVLHTVEGRVAIYTVSGSDEAGTAGGSVVNIPWANDRLAPRAGDYSAALRRLPATDALPVGRGFLRMQITTLGKAVIRGELANGLKWTAATSISSDGRLPLTAVIAGRRSLQGTLTFSNDSAAATELGGELFWKSTAAEKCPAYGDASTLSVAGDAAPVAKPTYDSFLERNRHELILNHPDLVHFGIAGSEAKTIFDTYEFQPCVARNPSDTNPLRLALRFERGAKLATGGFVLTAGNNRKVPIALRGAPVTDPETGETSVIGYFLFPSADGTTQVSGSVSSRFVRY